ncbi:hypothetical protein [Rubrimonas sp.]|uniref:hypothetical protein n=1 Tax=Rubrimonas sp. TaxID=2036015 RepID=UPI002FDEC6A0
MSVLYPHAFAAPERLRVLRLEITTRRRARQVNLTLLFRQHDHALRDAARRCDQSARVALGRLMTAVAADGAWTAALGRDLRAATRGVSAVVARLSHAPATADAMAWLRDRLVEVVAQDARVTALEAVLAAHRPEAGGEGAARGSKPRRRG